MTYTIQEVTPDNWVASNGVDNVEGDSPDDALYGLLSGENYRDNAGCDFDEGPKQERIERVERLLGDCCVRLIRLLAINAPQSILRNESALIAKHVETFITEQ